jgi:hypothetical protein
MDIGSLLSRCRALDNENALTGHERRYGKDIGDLIESVTSGVESKASALARYQAVLDHVGGTEENLCHPNNPEFNEKLIPIRAEVESIIADLKTWLNS